MKLGEAVETAKEMEVIEDILDGGGFLCSAYLMLDEEDGNSFDTWNLAFYSKDNEEITAVEVTEDGAEEGVTDAPLREDTGQIDLDRVKISAREGLEKVRNVLDEDYGTSYKKLLFSLKSEDGKQIWRAVFVGKSMSIISVGIDAENGEVVEKERKNISKGGFFGG